MHMLIKLFARKKTIEKTTTENKLESLVINSKNIVKWDNHLGEKAIFLYKDTIGYVYLVKNKGYSYFAYYGKDGFLEISNLNTLNFSTVKEVIVKNINKRLLDLDIRKQELLHNCKLLLEI